MTILKKVFIGAVLLATASFVVAEDDTGNGDPDSGFSNTESANDAKEFKMHANRFAPVLGPESYTSSTTQGRFGLDVDDYMDVNSWSNVKFDKGFGFLSYNSGVNNGISLGYATHLFGAYMGLWFAGYGGDFTLSSTLRTDGGDKEFLSYKTLNENVYAMAVLLGKGNKGLKATLVYDPRRGGSSYAFTDDGYKQGENYLLYADLALGVDDTMNYHVGFYADVARDNTTDGVDNGTFYDLYAGIGGLPFLFGFGVDLDTRLRIFSAEQFEHLDGDGKAVKHSREGEIDIIAKADISRGFTFAPIDRLAVKAKVGLPVELGIYSGPGDGYKDINIDLFISPVAKVGLQYALRPEKVNFNLGTKLGLGNLGLGIYNDDDETSLKLGYKAEDITLGFSSGFTLFLGKSVTLDAEWNIIKALIGDNLKSGEAFESSSVDTAVGNILFHEFSLLLSVKL